jgi:ATP-dependent DNA ligase
MILALRPATLLLDREVIALDRNKISRFQLLQGGTGRARYAVFDCLYLNGRDLTCQTLSTRRAALEKLISERDELILSHRLARKGFDAFRIAKKRGFEGLVAKRTERHTRARPFPCPHSNSSPNNPSILPAKTVPFTDVALRVPGRFSPRRNNNSPR